jgi:hypothetical protein
VKLAAVDFRSFVLPSLEKRYVVPLKTTTTTTTNYIAVHELADSLVVSLPYLLLPGPPPSAGQTSNEIVDSSIDTHSRIDLKLLVAALAYHKNHIWSAQSSGKNDTFQDHMDTDARAQTAVGCVSGVVLVRFLKEG